VQRRHPQCNPHHGLPAAREAALSAGCQTVFNTLDRQQTATRSLNAPGGDQGGWCAFGDKPAPGQDVWIAWCGESGQTN
jgi:hypothetical protein